MSIKDVISRFGSGGLKRGELLVITAPAPIATYHSPRPLRTSQGDIIHLTLEHNQRIK